MSTFKWEEMKVLTRPKTERLISKIKMKKIVLDESGGLWSYDFIGGKLSYSFHGWVAAEFTGPIVLGKDSVFTTFKK